jgi:hypothetical protein
MEKGEEFKACAWVGWRSDPAKFWQHLVGRVQRTINVTRFLLEQAHTILAQP